MIVFNVCCCIKKLRTELVFDICIFCIGASKHLAFTMVLKGQGSHIFSYFPTLGYTSELTIPYSLHKNLAHADAELQQAQIGRIN